MTESEDRHVEEPMVLSPSGIETWSNCERKGAWIYIAGIRPESNKSAALGGKVHKQLENYLKHGKSFDFTEPGGVADIAASIVHLLPKPGTPGLKVEGYFKFRSPETGIFYRGYKDAVLAPNDNRPRPKVFDHKTTSNIQKWAKTPKVLEKDVQANLYAYDELLKYPEADAVDLQWTYTQTVGARRGEPVQVTLTRAHVSEQLSRIELGTREIVRKLQLRPDPLSLPPNKRHCTEYGGCPFKSRCFPAGEGAFIGLSKNPRSSAMSLLPPASVLNKLGTPAEQAPSAPRSLLGGMLSAPAADAKGHSAAVQAPMYAPGCEPAAPTEIPARFLSPEPPKPANDQPINPPESLLPPAQAAGMATEAGAVQVTTPEAPTKGGRGRPKGSKNKPKEDENAPLPGQIALYAEEPVPAPEPVAPPTRPSGYALFINCISDSSSGFTRAETIIAQAHAEIRESAQVGDYRFVEFGKGAGILSARVAELAKIEEIIVLDTRSPEGMVCRDALIAGAAHVVRGF